MPLTLVNNGPHLEVIEMNYTYHDDSMSYFTVLFDMEVKSNAGEPSKVERMLATIFELNQEPCEDLVMIMNVRACTDDTMINQLVITDPERVLAKELCARIKQEYML